MREKSMKALLISLISILFFISLLPSIPIAKAQPSFNSFSYYRQITITNSGSTALSNYTIKLTVDTATPISQGKMRSDAGDIRFFDSDSSTLLSYWIESGINTASTVIWVKIPSIPAQSSKTIYMVYGNPSLTSASSGSSTFLFFDDFSTYTQGASISGQGGWQYSADSSSSYATVTTYSSRTAVHIYDASGSLAVSHSYTISNSVTALLEFYLVNAPADWGLLFADTAGGYPTSASGYYFSVKSGGTPYWTIQRWSGGSSTAIASSSSNAPSNGATYTLNATWRGSTLYHTVYKGDGSVLSPTMSASDTTFSSRSYVTFRLFTGVEIYVFRIRIFAFASPKPTTSIGSECVIYYTKPYPLNTVYLNHTFVSSPSSFTFSLSSSNSSTASYTSPYYDNYGFKLDSLVQVMANVQYPNSYTIQYGSLVSGTLANLQAEDYSPMRFQAYNDTVNLKQYAVVDFVVTLPSSIPLSTVSYIMLYTSGNVSNTASGTKTTVYVYNFATSTFSALSNTAYNSTTRISYSTVITTPSNYLNSSGNFKLRVNYTYPTTLSYLSKLDIDILKITFKYNNGTSATLTATASVTLPYSTQTLKNITFLALATNTGTARSLNVTLTNSGGSKIATKQITPSSSWQMYSIPINANASGTLTLKVIMYALSSASASETVAIRDVKVFAYYYFNPSSGYLYDFVTYLRPIVNGTFSITLTMPSPLNSSIVYFKIPAQFLFNKTTYATSPTYIGNETINNIIYRVYRILGFTSTSKTDFFFVRSNALYNVKPLYKGIAVSKILVGEKIIIPLSAPTNVTIGSYNFQNAVGNFSFKVPASGSYDVVVNITDPNHWNIGYFKTSISAVLGSFSASPKDAFNNVLSYAQLSAYLYNATNGALVSSATFTTSATFSNLVAGNYTLKLYYKNLLVGVGSFNLVSSTNATTMLPKVRTFRVVDYRGANIGKVLAYSSGVNLTEADISRGKAFPRGIYQLKVNGSGSFTLFVDYLGNLPTKVAISSNASGLSYGWRGSILIINGTLGSTAVVNVTDLYKVFIDVRDMLERSLGFVPITINGSQVTPQMFTQPAYYNVSLPNMTNFFKFSKFSDGYSKTYRLITVNNSDVYVKIYYRIPISFKTSVNATTTIMSAFLRMLGLQQYNTVTAHVEGKIYDYFGISVPNKQIVVNITNLDAKLSGTFALTTDVSGYFRTPDIDLVKGAHYLISISAPDDPTYVGNSTSYTYTVQEVVAPIPSVAGIPLIYYIVGAVAVIVAIGIIIFGYKAMKHTIEDETERRRKFVRRKNVHAIEEESERKFIKKKRRGEEQNE